MSERFVLLSGCSAGGKSTLLAELQARGYHVVEEPGRRVVKHELEKGGNVLPWTDGTAFARRTIEVALSDREAAQELPDRGLIDAAMVGLLFHRRVATNMPNTRNPSAQIVFRR
jgi:predicted ATPase